MADIQNVTGTAFVVAEFRAEENSEPEPLYRDDIVPLFLDADTRQAADGFSAIFPGIMGPIRVRTRYLDDRLDRQLKEGFRQVVILGAGLDTRSVRKAAAGVTYFEIDDAETLSFKRTRLEASNIPVEAKLISGNYVAEDLIGLLERGGLDFKLPTHFIWEGNTMYLPEEAVRRVMRLIATRVEQFTLSFDYMVPEVIAKTTGNAAITAVVERFAAMGAPWTFGIDNVPALARDAGLSVAEIRKTGDLYRAYRPARPVDSPLYDYYFLCTLERAG